MKLLALRQAFDGGYLVSLVSNGQRQTRQHATSIQMDRTCATLPLIATFLTSSQSQMLAQRIEQCCARIHQ
jgi:hypothetical protein